jgi:hypothetical protein
LPYQLLSQRKLYRGVIARPVRVHETFLNESIIGKAERGRHLIVAMEAIAGGYENP